MILYSLWIHIPVVKPYKYRLDVNTSNSWLSLPLKRDRGEGRNLGRTPKGSSMLSLMLYLKISEAHMTKMLIFIPGDRHMAICYSIYTYVICHFSYICKLKIKLHSQQNYPVLEFLQSPKSFHVLCNQGSCPKHSSFS